MQQQGTGNGHAVLHDFCMAIPYGAVTLLAGLVLLGLGASTAVPQCIGGGSLVLLSSFLSFKAWKKQDDSTLFTLASGTAAGYVAYTAYGAMKAGVVVWLTGTILAISAALCLFCFYNVAAGGNPPPKKDSKTR